MDATFSFAAYEIAGMAADLELKGVEFYTKMAELLDLEPKAREEFWDLSRQELAHRVTFLQIAEQLKGQDEGQDYSIDLRRNLKKAFFDLLQQNAFGLTALSSGHLDKKAALVIAVHTEQASIEVFEKMLGAFVARFHPAIEQILGEEHGHLEYLSGLLADENSAT